MERQLKLADVYCFDTGPLVNLKSYPEGMDIFSPIWKQLEELSKAERLISHSEVLREINREKDQILGWCNLHKKIFKDTDNGQLKSLKTVKTQYDQKYWETMINKPGPWADPLVLALSLCQKATLVSNERNTPNHINFIAGKLNIKCLGFFDFLKEIGIK
jgi:hypothetical protein